MMKFQFIPFTIFLLGLAACAPKYNFQQDIAQYRAEKIKENTTGDRHPLVPGDEQWLRFFPPQEKYRVLAEFSAITDTTTFDMLTYSGKTRPYRRYGLLKFDLDGQEYRLTLYQNMTLIHQPKYRDYLFMPFKDASNGVETYKGGRYLDLKTTDIRKGLIRLDFNKVYNPWCAYSDGYNCPVPPVENHLKVAILAGEMNYAGEKHH
jgi:uncharacterized protein